MRLYWLVGAGVDELSVVVVHAFWSLVLRQAYLVDVFAARVLEYSV